MNTKKPNHYHLQAVSGRVVEHFHTTLGGASMKAHEHDGMRRYATTQHAIEKQRSDYLAMRKQKATEYRLRKIA